ncbi:MAG: histidine phosphatase family protein [Jiangellaceae bacterium]
MQLLMIRHAVPLRSGAGEGSDPALSDAGLNQAQRLPFALARYGIARIVSSPQQRAIQTATPVAEALGLPVDVEERLAEYDRDLPEYVPVEQIRAENPAEWARMSEGRLPSTVDETAFRGRVAAAINDIVAAADRADTVAVFAHGGVINASLHEILQTKRLLSFPVDYTSVTRFLFSRSGVATVVSVNSTDHVWDLLSRR